MSADAILALTGALLLWGSVHGGYDLAILLRQRPAMRAAGVIAAYAAVVVAVFFGYRAVPSVGAALLLALSVWHFGASDTDTPAAQRICCGAALLLAPVAAHPQALHYLGVTLSIPALPAWGIVTALLLASVRRGKALQVLQIAGWCLLALFLDVLLWFALYFALQHARAHMALLRRHGWARTGDVAWAWLAVLLSVLGTLLVAAVYEPHWQLSDLRAVLSPEVFAQYIAPLLLALSVPHSVLVDGFGLHLRTPVQR